MVVCLEGWLVKVSLFDSFTVAKTGKQKFKVDLARNRIQPSGITESGSYRQENPG